MEMKVGKCKWCTTEFDYVTRSPQSQIAGELHYCPLCKEPLFHISALSIGGIQRDPTQTKTRVAAA